MPALSDNVGLLFKIKADSSDAVKDLTKVQTEVGGLSKGFAGLAGPAAAAGVAITAVASAAVAAGVSLYKLTKETADYGSEIYDATEKTGLAAETISSLKIAADQSGTSLDAVTGGLARFAKTIGEAEGGSDKAQAALKKLHVTSKDLDTALAQALVTIAKYPPGVQQMTAAQAAFGRSGADLLPFIKSFDGNLPALIAKCKELGLTMSDVDAKAADEFADTMQQLDQQMAAAGRTIGVELLPVFTDLANEISAFLANNKDDIKGWGTETSNWLYGIIGLWKDAADAAKEYGLATPKPGKGVGGLGSDPFNDPLGFLGLYTRLRGTVEQSKGVVRSTGDPGTYEAAPRPRVNLNPAAGGNNADDSDKEALKAAAAAQKAYQAKVAIYRRELAEKMAMSDQIIAQWEKEASEGIWSAGRLTFAREALEAKNLQNKLQTLQKEKKAAEEFGQETLDLQSQIKIAETKIETQKLETITAANKRAADQVQKDWEDAMERAQIAFDAFMADVAKGPTSTEDTTAHSAEIVAGVDALNVDKLTPMKQALIDLKAIGQDALGSLAQGIGNLVQQWVLMGSTGPNAMKKLVAGILGGVAAQAAVLAVMELAYGVAALTPWGAAIYGPAAAHFKAAALFGSVAALAAAAGRGVAGNAFQNQTSGGGASGGASQQTSRGDKFTEAFSGFGQRMDRMNERLNTVLGGVEEQLHNFATKFSAVTPGHVVMAGAGDGAQAIFDAHTSVLGSGGSATESMVRAQGRFR